MGKNQVPGYSPATWVASNLEPFLFQFINETMNFSRSQNQVGSHFCYLQPEANPITYKLIMAGNLSYSSLLS